MENINLKLSELLPLLKEELPNDTTTVNIFINCEGIQFKFNQRSHESLKKDGISMRNINGDFI